MDKKNLANYITVTRIIGTFFVLFSETLSKPFFIAYIYSGFSDVLDGFVARTLKIESNIGRKLDSVSDLFFYTTMVIKLWPHLVKILPSYIITAIWVILGIRIAIYLFFYIGQKKFLSNHTILNKISGAMIFCVPFVIENKMFVTYATMIVVVVAAAALYDMMLVINNKEK